MLRTACPHITLVIVHGLDAMHNEATILPTGFGTSGPHENGICCDPDVDAVDGLACTTG